DQHDTNVGQSRKADHLLRDAGFQADPQTEIVLVQSKTRTVNDPAFRAVVADVVNAVRPSTAIEQLRSPYGKGNTGQISADRHSAMVQWRMKGDSDAATKRIPALTKATDAVAKAH